MKFFSIFSFLNLSLGLVFNNRKLNILDKNHVKNYADNWINIWKEKPYALSDLRINEAWKSIIMCSQNKYKQNFYCLTFNNDDYFILLFEDENDKSLKISGLLESPNNIYYPNQMEDLHQELQILSKESNCTLDYSLMRNWSHGFYFYEYR